MPNFFTSLAHAGASTIHALIKGPSKTPKEMYESQETRFQTFQGLMSSLSYHSQQLEARKQYWCAQTFFLAQLIKANEQKIAGIIGASVNVEDEAGLLETINKLIITLDNERNVQRFIEVLTEDCHKIETTQIKQVAPPIPESASGIQYYNGDVIELIQNLSVQGTLVVVDNAPNSHRDGAAKYSAGSVEELFSRYTDSALKMALHFDDVHQRNYQIGYYAFTEKPEAIDVLDYQKRYLKMVLTICSNLIHRTEDYLESEDFLNDLFTSFPNQKDESFKLPIYFDMQNNVYEVPVDGGFTSAHWFVNTKQLNTVEGIFQLLKIPDVSKPINVVSYAAPDLRKLETSPLDARATSNKRLQRPAEEGNLGCMLAAGIALQCQQAIQLAQHYKAQGINQPIAVIFVMPGCGAFNNPERSTAAHFISTIKYFYPQLAEHNISCHVAEFNPKLYNLLVQSNDLYGSELGQLNELINQLVEPLLRQKVIAVREKIVALYEHGESAEHLTKQLRLTIELLMSQPGEKRNRIVTEYEQNALSLQKSSDSLWNALAVAMIALGSLITTVGVVLCATGLALLPGTGVAACGTALLGVGIGLFAQNKHNALIRKTTDLLEEIDNTHLLP
ncbi:hypothetical protein [Legionella fallonii]|uniref:Uncharacterized protein n=1 Tax=Legionella fallonii LLAP-10 TaxID=1212491 RepID=A0A098G6A7_9GAMM|nr:hypothetical protein [Legionella fallonii]CEG57511.1 conserved protein of unknown function [Legionella fallonii LLAP-10]